MKKGKAAGRIVGFVIFTGGFGVALCSKAIMPDISAIMPDPNAFWTAVGILMSSIGITIVTR